MENMTSRKLWVTLLGMAISTYLKMKGTISDDAFESILIAGMIGYPTANVIQKAIEAKKETEQ